MLIDGFSISGYRSFGEEIQRFAPLGKINLIIGKNNSGKSNVLRFINNHFKNCFSGLTLQGISKNNLEEIDNHIGKVSVPFRIGFSLNLYSEKALKRLEESEPGVSEYLNRIFNSEYVKNNYGFLELLFDFPLQNNRLKLSSSHIQDQNILTQGEWNQLSLNMTSNASDINSYIQNVLFLLSFNIYQIPNIYLIPAIRNIVKADQNEIDLSGAGIIEKLAILQNPDHNKQNLKLEFNKVNEFLCSVIGNNNAQIEIPHSRDKIIVHMDGKSLPLESLGTGIHEVIIIAAAATLYNNSIICIEEPEIHLHPMLQKKLISYLNTNTTNQYFIATHSAHLLDAKNTNIFHIRHDGVASKVINIKSNDSIFEICSELGYRPSDLLQTNCIIWVEGPSDRIYLNYWLKALDENLIEGTHYSIMFYGGRLLSHLTTEDEQINDFISLTRLNRNSIIVIDRDRTKIREHINATKKRIFTEFENSNKIAWITKGREIENYIDPDIFETCVKAVHPSAEKLENKTIYSNLPNYIKKNQSDVVTASKIKVAKEVVKNDVDLSILDLKEKMTSIYNFIKEIND